MAVSASFFAVQSLKTSSSMPEILSNTPLNSLLVLDIDDTIGRLPHVLGLDAWFRFKLSQFVEQEDDFDKALLMTIALYNPIQQASPSMITVDDSFSIKDLVDTLKNKGITVIGLTARNNALVDATFSQLDSLDFSFSQGILEDSTFKLDGKTIEIKDGIIFSDGSNKGLVLLEAEKYLSKDLNEFSHITFVDDSKRNCSNMKKELENRSLPHTVCHYTFAQDNHLFADKEIQIANNQEAYFLQHGIIPSDEEALDSINAMSNLAP